MKHKYFMLYYVSIHIMYLYFIFYTYTDLNFQQKNLVYFHFLEQNFVT